MRMKTLDEIVSDVTGLVDYDIQKECDSWEEEGYCEIYESLTAYLSNFVREEFLGETMAKIDKKKERADEKRVY